ncbi:hypothetical protein K7I13_00575 [Brucepastera parasyntrophica]|uniref:hypothetical protein n=1 Tax=Brucepastera parasyntrophica TaxID=2880008 RepID=UPI00210B1EDC|nr:hypothetical protein [Brucepastera parasyntrophica]ULQ59883.1 hypothetical protein K7I13_00575 [Brucepastera parasyntrophica]
MNNNLRHFLVSHPFLLKKIFFIKRTMVSKKFNHEVFERQNTNLFNIDLLSEDMIFCPFDYVVDNHAYGINATLKSYSGLDVSFECNSVFMEHGVYFGDYVSTDLAFYKNVPKIITFSETRVNHLRESGCNKTIYPIGPYIQYANNLKSDEENACIKKKYGRILLCFPPHSVAGVNSDFSKMEYILEIKKIAKHYDSVFINLYYLDAQKPDVVQFYQSNNFHIVTAGHKNDINFLNRLRTIIELADMTMSNAVGTHVGYCIALNKPHYIYPQETKRWYGNAKDEKHFAANIRQESSVVYQQETSEVKNSFSVYNTSILNNQLEVVKKYWGPLSPVSQKDINTLLLT